MNNPVVSFFATLGAIAIGTVLALYVSNNFHCVNLPIFGLKCAIG